MTNAGYDVEFQVQALHAAGHRFLFVVSGVGNIVFAAHIGHLHALTATQTWGCSRPWVRAQGDTRGGTRIDGLYFLFAR